MTKITISNCINILIQLYILSLYIFTYREGYNSISNVIAGLLITLILFNNIFKRKRIVVNGFIVAYILFLIICLISILFAVDQNVAFIKVRTLFLLALLMFSIINYIDSIEKLDKLISGFIFSGLIASIYIVITSDFSQIARFGDYLGNVNAVGMIIGISATFSFYRFLEQKKLIYLIILIIMFVMILLTGSRKSILFILMNVVIILYLKNRDSGKITTKIKFLILCFLILLITSYLIFNVPYFYRIIGKRIENLILYLFGGEIMEGSINLRAYMISTGLKFFKQSPLLGFGIDNYRKLFSQVPDGRYTYAHNNIIELLVDTGIIGVIVYYLTHLLVLRNLFRVSKASEFNIVSYTLIAIIISYIILSIALVYYDSKHFSILLAVASIVPRVHQGRKTQNLNWN